MKTTPIYILLLLSVTSLFAQNIALQKATTTSSVRDNNQGAFAVDGNQSTRWESDFSDPQFIIVDLATTYALNRIEIDWEAAYATQYQIQLSNNKQQWTTASNITSGNGGTDVVNLNGQNARYVRMYGTQRTTIGSTQYGYSFKLAFNTFSKSLFNCPFYGVKRHEKINFPLMLFFYFKFE